MTVNGPFGKPSTGSSAMTGEGGFQTRPYSIGGVFRASWKNVPVGVKGLARDDQHV